MANGNGKPRPGDTNHDEEIARAMQRQFQLSEKAKQRAVARQSTPQANPRRSPPANRKAPPVNPRAPPANQQRAPQANGRGPPANRVGNQQRVKKVPPNRKNPLGASGISTIAVNADDGNLPGHVVATESRDRGPLPFSVVAVPGKKKKKPKGGRPRSSRPGARAALIPTGGRDIEEEKMEIDDEVYAQQMQMSFRSGEDFHDDIGNDDIGNESLVKGPAISDVEYARRLEQELRDQQVAEQLQSILDQKERTARIKSEKMVNGVPVGDDDFDGKQRRCSKKNTGYSTMTFILTLGVIGALFIAFSGGNGTGWGGGIFPDNDPFNDANPGDPNRWRIASKNGLKMTMLNALDARWQTFFDIAIIDWDSGIPDSVTLFTEDVSFDKDCDRVRDKVKVCNGDYGLQDWKGICKVYLEFGYISAATVQLNDFFFKDNANPDDMQYTMCHELGHSLGLQHTDEDFFNKDLGNCMDYSTNPGANMRPDDGNFQVLFSLYGEVNFNTAEDQAARDSMNIPGTRFLKEEANLSSASEFEDATADVSTDSWWRKLLKPSPSSGRMKLLYESKFSKLHAQDLGNGRTVLVHKILP
eukprot:scaffold115361_cov47-Attheya_sp.AAC.1